MFQYNDPKSAKSVDLMPGASRNWAAIHWLAVVCALMFAMAPITSASEGPGDLSGVVNINTASSAELQLLPGVGEKRAEAIIDIRKTKGGFQSLDDLVAVKGLGEAMLERMRPHVTLKGKTTARRL